MAKNLTILLIGFAAGYMAACLAEKVGREKSVDTPDSISESINERLRSLEQSYEPA